MKKHYALICLILLLAVLANAQSTKLSGEFWSRWTMEQSRNAATGDDEILKNYLALERGYLGLETVLSDDVKARFTIDLFSSDAVADGAGIKLKYAYVDFANLLPVADMNFTAGLQKVYFGSIYDWDYSLIGKAPADEYKLANSADYGLSINGYLPSGLGSYALGIYNGEGYKKFGSALKDNTNFAYSGNLRLTPLPGLSLGASLLMNSVEREHLLSDDSINSKYQEQMLADAMIKAVFGPVDVMVEYLYKDIKHSQTLEAEDYSASGIMIFPTLNLSRFIGYDVQVLGRYDIWDESERSESSKYKLQAIT
ncbi:MAG: hypothetical protein LHW46_07755, partial [Candidatus Cloacimonetes bacterium]|nr:hypothetical protein [Candidatus Cloacimonadota bacterium]